MKDWPSHSSPTLPPKCCLYYAREIGGTPQEVFARPYAEVWQMGAVLNAVFDNEDVENIEYHDSWIVRFDVVIERDAHGQCVRRRSMWARSFMHNLDEAMLAGKKFVGRIPWHDEAPVRFMQGLPPRSCGEYEGVRSDTVRSSHTIDRSEVPEVPSGSKNVKRERASRSGLITLGQLCEGKRMQPGDVRAELRRRKIDKPAQGWAFEETDTLIDVVRDIIKNGK